MSTFILGREFHIVEGENTNKRFVQPQRILTPKVLLELPAHIVLPPDSAHYESEILALAWKMHLWLLREWELGRYQHVQNNSFIPLEPFGEMLGLNWPDSYEICGWSRALHSDREQLLVHEDEGNWRIETKSEYAIRKLPPPSPPSFSFCSTQEEELELVAGKLERLFSPENPNRVSTVRKILSPSGTSFMEQMAKDFCHHLYVENHVSSPSQHLSPELLLPILQQLLPALITEELAARAHAPLAPLEELGEAARAERQRLEGLAAGRNSALGPT